MKKRISPTEINWKNVAERLIQSRQLLKMDRPKFAQLAKLPTSSITSYETGKSRKTFGNILNICQSCGLNSSWLLMGIGKPFAKNISNLIDPMKLDRGAGKRRSNMRKQAEEGEMNEEMLEFILAVDEFKSKNKKIFPSLTEVYQVMLYLGYRKVEKRSPHINCILNK